VPFVTDEICDRFCVIGNQGRSLREAAANSRQSVDQFNVY
jgi:hypothetical protein